jgi:hypothetical protein
LSFLKFLERAKGLEPSTPTLARLSPTLNMIVFSGEQIDDFRTGERWGMRTLFGLPNQGAAEYQPSFLRETARRSELRSTFDDLAVSLSPQLRTS